MSTARSGLWDDEVLPAVELAINSSVSTATGLTPFDAIFIDSPRLLDALLRDGGHDGVGDWAERFRLARARLSEARTRIRTERLRQKEGYDERHAAMPALAPGSSVWIRLRDRPVRSAPSGKMDPVRLGPFVVRRVLSPHRVLVDVPPELNIDDEFDISQLEPHPTEDDPFEDERDLDPTAPSTSASASSPQPAVAEVDPPAASSEIFPRRGQRQRQPALIVRDPTPDRKGEDR
ncbi:unnamed protein product [Tilletia controversa]|nr:unnamed protein product [Tilletia controversa]